MLTRSKWFNRSKAVERPDLEQIRHGALFRMRPFVLTVTAFCILSAATHLQAQPDDSANSFQKLTVQQMQDALKKAAAADLMPDSIEAHSGRTSVLYDLQLKPNPDALQWTTVINASSSVMRARERKLTSKGYERTISVRARAGRLVVITAVWVRIPKEPVPLVLPDVSMPVSGDKVEGMERLDQVMEDFLRTENAAGATVAVGYRGQLIYDRAFGYSDIETETALKPSQPMRIASISKLITAVAVLRLQDAGQLKLDDAVVPILRDAGYRIPSDIDSRWNSITIRHLLHHSGGWNHPKDDDPVFQVARIAHTLKLKKSADVRHLIRHQLNQPLDFEPGTKMIYCNFGYVLLGRIIEAVTEKPYSDAVQELVLDPAQMSSTAVGRSVLKDRLEFEPIYHMQTTQWTTPYWTGLEDFGRRDMNNPDLVAEPYGQWKIEVLDSAAGWTSTSSDLVRLMNKLEQIDSEQPTSELLPAGLLSSSSIGQMLARPKGFESRGSWMGFGCSVIPIASANPNRLSEVVIMHYGTLSGTSTLIAREPSSLTLSVLFNTDNTITGEELAQAIYPQLLRTLRSCQLPDVLQQKE